MDLKKVLDPRLWVVSLKEPRMLAVGARAPVFTATAHDGSIVRLEDHAAGRVLLWFYPAADTPG